MKILIALGALAGLGGLIFERYFSTRAELRRLKKRARQVKHAMDNSKVGSYWYLVYESEWMQINNRIADLQ